MRAPRAMLVIPLYFQYGSWYLIRPHFSTFTNLGSCNCSSWKLLAVINMTRSECSVVMLDHILAYAARYLSRVRNLDRLSPKTHSDSRLDPSANLLGKREIFLLRIVRGAFCHLLRDRLWKKKKKKIVSFSLIFFISTYFTYLPKNIFSRLSREIYCRTMKVQRNLRKKALSSVTFYAVTSFYIVKL